MIIQMNNLEVGVLTFHMTSIRKQVKQGFKKTYGKIGGKENLLVYDSVKERLGSILDTINDQTNVTEIGFSTREMNLVVSFIDWYVPEIKKVFKQLTEEDQIQIDTLQVIREKMKQGLLDYAAI